MTLVSVCIYVAYTYIPIYTVEIYLKRNIYLPGVFSMEHLDIFKTFAQLFNVFTRLLSCGFQF